ncbi:MAG: hypothetical protein A2270_07420 [Elusimicrobia bacterium RIFOXYA12_FULL_51_18]|nr:MAG: hypothetical protein A2270_07420 [Elusimicrobia bacterium RIFOXYA12_FULL_51_18]OGS28511.1 MAG: hypothetical protein A2218_05725 [Elusimicrobia bacterium RIFOXYA2_FULL_53_38]
MTRNNLVLTRIFLTLLFPFFCGLRPVQANDNVYKKMAADIAKYSSINKVKSIAVLAFSRKARTSREESEYVSERLLTCLAESGKVKLLERSQLDQVLQEQKLGLAGLTEGVEDKKEGALSSADVIIIGVVFGTADHLKIIAKMIDPGTGAVLHVIEAQTERQWDMVMERPGFEFDVLDMTVLVGMFADEAKLPALNDFRDAPRNVETGDCSARRTRLIKHQASAMEAKAKYWALKMRDPDFSSEILTRNPGGEIADPQMKKIFYRLLDEMYKSDDAPRLSFSEEEEVRKIMEEEKRLSDDCGLH